MLTGTTTPGQGGLESNCNEGENLYFTDLLNGILNTSCSLLLCSGHSKRKTFFTQILVKCWRLLWMERRFSLDWNLIVNLFFILSDYLCHFFYLEPVKKKILEPSFFKYFSFYTSCMGISNAQLARYFSTWQPGFDPAPCSRSRTDSKPNGSRLRLGHLWVGDDVIHNIV